MTSASAALLHRKLFCYANKVYANHALLASPQTVLPCEHGCVQTPDSVRPKGCEEKKSESASTRVSVDPLRVTLNATLHTFGRDKGAVAMADGIFAKTGNQCVFPGSFILTSHMVSLTSQRLYGGMVHFLLLHFVWR
jgi:hypothetical protein